MQARDHVFGGRIVPGWQGRGLHALLHVDDDQGWWLGHADSSLGEMAKLTWRTVQRH
jgi:hypothetical protein